MRRVVGLRPTKTTLSQPAKAKRRSWQKAPRGFLRVHWGGSPNRVFTNTRSRSSSRAQEARNGSDSSKAQTKKAKDTEKSSKPSSASGAKAGNGKHRENEQFTKSRAIPVFREYPFSIGEFAGLTRPNHKMTVLSESEIDKQERNQHTLC